MYLMISKDVITLELHLLGADNDTVLRTAALA